MSTPIYTAPNVNVQASTFGKQLINQPSKQAAQGLLSVPRATASFNLISDRNTWRKAAKFTTNNSSSPTNLLVKSSTGYAIIMNHDGTYGATGTTSPSAVSKVGSGDSEALITLAGRATASPYNSRLPKFYAIYPCDASGDLSGDLTYFQLSTKSITSIDVAGLSELTYLGLASNYLTSIDLTGLSKVTSLNLNNNQLASFDGTDLSAVTYLQLNDNLLTSFDGTGLSALGTLNLNNNQLASFDGTGLSALTGLQLNGNQLTSFDGTGLSALGTLELDNNQFINTDLTGLSALTTLNLRNNPLTIFDATGTGLSAVTSLNLEYSQFTSFVGTGLSALQTLHLEYCQLTSFDGTGLSALQTLRIEGNQLTSVLLSSFIGLNVHGWQHFVDLDLSNQQMTTDAVWAMMDSILAPAIDQPYPINLTGNPCDAADGAPPNLVEDGVHTQAEIEALLTAKGYSLQLTDGTIAP
jgi:Leucine-rich repeat (LRR) protein